jgi:hypothetical protein
MANPAGVLKFPGGKGKPEVSLPLTREGPSTPAFDKYDYDEAVALYQIATFVKNKAEDLSKFVDENRQIARQAGIEMLVVQITSILEGEKFQRVVDALQDAVYRRVPITLTRDGADKVHRLEKLISEADSSVIQFMTGRKAEPNLGQGVPLYSPASIPIYADRGSNDVSTWIPVVVIGIAGIVGVIAIIALTNRPRETIEAPTVPSKIKSRKT